MMNQAQQNNVNVPSAYRCPITLEIMFNPVIADDGFTYEKSAIEHYLENYNGKSPQTREEISNNFKLNRTLKSLINEFLSNHPSAWSEVHMDVSSLLTAIKEADKAKVETLLRQDSRLLTAKLEGDQTGLHLLAQQAHGSEDMLSLFINHIQKHRLTATIKNMPKPDNWNPVYLNKLLVGACKKGDLAQAKSLLKLGADINSNEHQHSNTPLHWAAKFGHAELVKLLCQRGANIEAKSIDGSTALNYAGYYGKPEVAKVLLAYKANKAHQDDGGNTPLHDAAHNGYKETVKVFLEAGVSPFITNNSKENAADYARKHGKSEMAEYIFKTYQSLQDEQAQRTKSLEQQVASLKQQVKQLTQSIQEKNNVQQANQATHTEQTINNTLFSMNS